MVHVRKFEFVNDHGQFSVVEAPPETSKCSVPEGDGRFCRTWIGEQGVYRVSRLKISDSPFVNTLCVKGGHLKIKNKDYVV